MNQPQLEETPMEKVLKELLIVLAVIPLYLVSCATPPTINDVAEVDANTKVVFGSVVVYKDGKQEKWGVKFTGFNYFYLTILPPDTNEAITYKLDKDGVFYWALPPGEYTLLGYYWQDHDAHQTGHIGTRFSVPETGKDVYLGTIEFRGNMAFLVPQFQDKYDEIAKLYDTKFPRRKGTAIKQLFKPPQPVGNFSSYRDVCNDDWKIECKKPFHGVTPISPEVSQVGFPVVKGLKPEFRWKSSATLDIGYDLILYEAAAYAVGGATSSSYMRGRVIAYEEDLKEPYWQPEKPLKSDTRYFWSVRLREGNTVSEWSTHGHFMFLIVAMRSSYGQWFQFKTP